MILWAFDCDGTLGTSNGPVSVDMLQTLSQFSIIVIVSPSGACGGLPYPRFDNGPDRKTNLDRAKAAYPDCEKYVYVSDNPGDDVNAAQAGYELVLPQNFKFP